MKYSPHLGNTLHSYRFSAQHQNATIKQMKESQTSERKKTQMSLIFHLFFSDFVTFSKNVCNYLIIIHNCFLFG